MAVAKHLHLDVARALHVLLDQHCVAAKAVDGLALTGGQCRRKRIGLFHHTQAAPAATCAGLDQHRVTDVISLALEQHRILVTAVVARHQRHASGPHEPLGFGFQAHGLDAVG